jgi:hypothetical protein
MTTTTNPATLRQRARAALYGRPADRTASPSAATAAMPRDKFEAHAARAQKMYAGGRYARAVDNYYDRRCLRFNAAGDAEGVRLSREEKAKMLELAQKSNVPVSALETLLAVQHEFDSLPAIRENLGMKPRAAEDTENQRQWTREQLRLKCGDSAARDQMLHDYLAVTAVIARELPEFARRMDETGSALDLRNVEALAPLGAQLRQAAQQK